MFEKGDKVVCADASDSILVESEEYVVDGISLNGFIFIEGFNGKFFADCRFKLVESKPPIWNNKRPKDMTKEELKAFICDRIDEVKMEFYDDYGRNWYDSVASTFSYALGVKYRIKPAKSDKLVAAEKALEEAQAAVKVAQEAVEAAKE